MAVLVQIIGALIICFSSINLGIFSGWPSSTILLFKSANTTLHRPMTDVEVGLFCSLPTLATLVTVPFMGATVIDKLGRKRTLILVSLLLVIYWCIIALSNRVEAVLTASVIGGSASSVALISYIYIAEVTQNSLRGALTAAPNLFCYLGFLVSYTLGGFLEYYVMVYTCLSLAVAGVLMLMILKESPVSHMMAGKEKEAAKSISFYRSLSTTSEEVLTELENIRLTLSSDTEGATLTLIGEKTEIKEVKTKNVSCWKIFKTKQVVRRQFYLGMVLMSSYVCNGLLMVQIYSEPIFDASVGDVMSPNLCSIIFGLTVIFGGGLASYLIEALGRRSLQMHTPILSGICCAFLGIQIATDCLPKWTVPFFVCVFAASFTVGTGTVPFVVMTEIFTPEIKSIFITVLTTWMAALQFSLFFLFNLIVPRIGLAPMFFFFSFSCFASSAYFFYFLPETKGLSIHTIQTLFTKKFQNKLFCK